MGTCTRPESFSSEFINVCEDLQCSFTRMNSTFNSVLNLNLNFYFHLLILLSGDMSPNLGPTHHHKQQCLNEWNIFKSKGIQFFHPNINSLLPEIEKLPIIAETINAAIIGIKEYKQDELSWNLRFKLITIKLYGEGVTCYMRNDLSCKIVSVFPPEIESVFFDILLPNSKPITLGKIYRPPNQSSFLEALNKNMNEIDRVSNEIYTLGDFNLNLSLNDSYIFPK